MSLRTETAPRTGWFGGGLITDRGLFWTLAALSMFGPFAADTYLPALPSLRTDLHASVSMTNLTLTASIFGMALGQMVGGAISDAQGRTRPVRIGLVGFAATSLLCAIAPSMWVLVAVRFVQGVCGGVAIVIARAVVRDLYEGVRAAQMFAMLVMLSGVAPIVAPLVGGGILALDGSWRGVFVVLAVIGVITLLASMRFVPETLDVSKRRSGELREIVSVFGRLMRDRSFAPWAWCFALTFSMLFAYISGGSYVLENVYGVSPQVFSLIFGANALAYAFTSQACIQLVERYPAARLARIGLVIGAFVALAALAVVVVGTGIWPLLILLFLMDASVGMVMPTSMAVAMTGQTDDLGSAAALIGLLQFGLAAALAPFVGLGGAHDAVPMGIAMAGAAVLSLVVGFVVARPTR